MRDDLKTNPISWYIFTVNTAAWGGAGAARKLNSLWAHNKGSEVEFLLSYVGEGHSAIQEMFRKAVIKARQLTSRAGALISQQAPNFTSITPSPSRLCYVFPSLYWFNTPLTTPSLLSVLIFPSSGCLWTLYFHFQAHESSATCIFVIYKLCWYTYANRHLYKEDFDIVSF